MNIEKLFNDKIDSIKNHSKYEWLRDYSNEVLCKYDDFTNRSLRIKSEDFISRIVSMPSDYIQSWLDGTNNLEWREQDKKFLKALKGDYLDLYYQHSDLDIHKIEKSDISFWVAYLGFVLLKENNNIAYVGK